MSNFFLALVYLSSVILIALVTAQTTKSEGLGAGMGGGGAQSSSKYLPGQEEILQKYTTWAATVWMFLCLVWFILSSRGH